MDLREEILQMQRDEYLTVGEIASALKQDPTYVYSVLYER